ncbi:hypothetical protein EW146_g665 [Bondarzewia mesenterica]|uniref:Protein kinase domain-containing protein n=1 Tax=Bondarzewia mesenterica TaxID=1095465 RepID=A0A4V3XGA9_9AGAM|nr:hypothetical protein EW146_g665 [Bondarzewia mesenterica]
MSPSHYTRIVLNQRPEQDIDANTFRQEKVPFDLKPGVGQVLVKVTWLSTDPSMRAWLNDQRSYLPPVQIGETMRAGGLATIVEAGEGSKLTPGQLVACVPGWTEFAILNEKDVQPIQLPPGGQELDFLGPLGYTGLTAYFGLNDIGKVKPGDMMVVSGAAGAVGSIACQIGKRQGAKVIAIAGTDEKCRWLEEELGVDKAINYKSPTFQKEFIDAVDYLDVFFDNVGGDILNLALTRLKQHARIVLSGAISDYNNAKPKGLTSLDYASQYAEARKEIAGWLADGSLKRKFQIVEGLENAPHALTMLFNGGNTGKLATTPSMAMAASSSSSSTTSPEYLQKLELESSRLRTQIKSEIDEADDPLALYDQFVKWTFDKYPHEYIGSSGLLELLEEATRKFKDDSSYKGDLRYLKMWSLYASLVDKPGVVFKFLLSRGIGTVYAQLYEEYALVLERDGRNSAADEVYRAGIKRKARPSERLKKRYDQFRLRSSANPPPPPPQPTISLPKIKGTPEAEILRRHPLKNHDAPPPKPPPASSASTSSLATTSTSLSLPSTSSNSHNRYAPMLAPPVPGKRPEKLQFDLSLLFTEDATEYSVQEARARSMGLLGKKWGPPPASELTRLRGSSVRVDFNDEGTKNSRNFTGRKSLVGEPTVTINTKEALADVFGMYNSPEKSMRFATMPGSKHAPVRRIEPITPMAPLLPQARPSSNENAAQGERTPVSFRPFVDDNDNRKENTTPGPAKQFKPFVDVDLVQKTPTIAPNGGRKVLSIKEPSTTPGPVLMAKSDENTTNVNSRNFAPSSKGDLKPTANVFVDEQKEHPETNVFRVVERGNRGPGATRPAKFKPFSDAQPFKVFSRPPDGRKEALPSSIPSNFKPFVDPENAVAPQRQVLGNRQPLRQFRPPEVKQVQEEDSVAENYEDSRDIEGDADVDDRTPIAPDEPGERDYEDDTQDGLRPHRTPLGGRFGQFDVMTPITERTFEYTSSTRVTATPNEYTGPVDKGFMQSLAAENAERLAAELREEEENTRDTGRLSPPSVREFVVSQSLVEHEIDEDVSSFASFDNAGRPPFRVSDGHTIPIGELRPDASTVSIEERTGTLSLFDSLALASSFKPPNPCNPSDPPIISTLLSLLPADTAYFNLVHQEARMLDELQKFAQRKGRRTSGNTSSNRSTQEISTFPISLGNRRFQVYEKVGEGGFGAVYAAKDISSKPESDDSDEDDFDEEDDEDEINRVALKVVKPRNLWEFHVLRKIHRTLPVRLRTSIISPRALYAFRDESFLVLDLCTQGTLLEIINRANTAGISQQGACLDELLVAFFTIEFLRLLEGLHIAGFIHGDLKIDNCLIRLDDVPGSAVAAWSGTYDPSGGGGWSYKGIKMIDFGRTIDTSMFPHGQTFIAEWQTDARDCSEMREDRPWTYQADYFGLAGIVYCMLYGKYIEASSVVPVPGSPGRHKLSTPFKRYWQTDIWTRLFDILLNPCLVRPDGRLPLSDELAQVRGELETWLQGNCNRSSNTLKGLLKKVELSVMRGE